VDLNDIAWKAALSGDRKAGLEAIKNLRNSDAAKATKIQKSDHARLRSSQGRSTSQAHSDLQKARDSDIFVQNDGRFVIRGPKGREHIIESSGELVTTVNGRSNKAHLNKVGKSRFRASAEDLARARSFLGGE